ncbi:MAG: DNA gyrase inhibitor YacG [Deltaproteobacteria bacterium]|nr:DNA gyrase inhibitor YacG [Deltaproteobacteria bacterium]
MQVTCPRCAKLVQWERKEWRPFCSERCKLLDLGAWASERFRVPEEPILDENLKQLNEIDEEK